MIQRLKTDTASSSQFQGVVLRTGIAFLRKDPGKTKDEF